MQPHILFITSTNLASNPRCRKEINLALGLHYRVTYIAFNLYGWSAEKERQIQNELPEAEKMYLSAGRENLLNWVITASLEFFLRKAYKIISATSLISYAASRRSLQLMLALQKIKAKPDLVIAHNPAAFYPAYYFAKKNKIPFAVDAEDYHSGEGNNKTLTKLNSKLIKKIFPAADYVSFAAPLIKEKIVSDILPCTIKAAIIINNVFSQKEFVPPVKTVATGKIRLVWFSQNIDKGRGLEEILPVIENLKDYFEITLIGNVREDFYIRQLKGKVSIKLLAPLPQKELNNRLAAFDIGLAIETTAADENRGICLTNKIWAYYQAGLFIVASDTAAQRQFIEENKSHGVVVNLFNSATLQQEFMSLYGQWHDLLNQRFVRFEKAKINSWETESELLQMKWKEILQN